MAAPRNRAPRLRSTRLKTSSAIQAASAKPSPLGECCVSKLKQKMSRAALSSACHQPSSACSGVKHTWADSPRMNHGGTRPATGYTVAAGAALPAVPPPAPATGDCCVPPVEPKAAQDGLPSCCLEPRYRGEVLCPGVPTRTRSPGRGAKARATPSRLLRDPHFRGRRDPLFRAHRVAGPASPTPPLRWFDRAGGTTCRAPRRRRPARAASTTSTRAGCVHDEPRPAIERETFGGRFDEVGRPYRRTATVGWRSSGTMRCPRMRTRRRDQVFGQGRHRATRDEGSPCEYLSVAMVVLPARTAALPLVILHGRVDARASWPGCL